MRSADICTRSAALLVTFAAVSVVPASHPCGLCRSARLQFHVQGIAAGPDYSMRISGNHFDFERRENGATGRSHHRRRVRSRRRRCRVGGSVLAVAAGCNALCGSLFVGAVSAFAVATGCCTGLDLATIGVCSGWSISASSGESGNQKSRSRHRHDPQCHQQQTKRSYHQFALPVIAAGNSSRPSEQAGLRFGNNRFQDSHAVSALLFSLTLYRTEGRRWGGFIALVCLETDEKASKRCDWIPVGGV